MFIHSLFSSLRSRCARVLDQPTLSRSISRLLRTADAWLTCVPPLLALHTKPNTFWRCFLFSPLALPSSSGQTNLSHKRVPKSAREERDRAAAGQRAGQRALRCVIRMRSLRLFRCWFRLFISIFIHLADVSQFAPVHAAKWNQFGIVLLWAAYVTRITNYITTLWFNYKNKDKQRNH